MQNNDLSGLTKGAMFAAIVAWAEEGTTTMSTCACRTAFSMSEVTNARRANPCGPPSPHPGRSPGGLQWRRCVPGYGYKSHVAPHQGQVRSHGPPAMTSANHGVSLSVCHVVLLFTYNPFYGRYFLNVPARRQFSIVIYHHAGAALVDAGADLAASELVLPSCGASRMPRDTERGMWRDRSTGPGRGGAIA